MVERVVKKNSLSVLRACIVECEAYSSGVAPQNGTGVSTCPMKFGCIYFIGAVDYSIFLPEKSCGTLFRVP